MSARADDGSSTVYITLIVIICNNNDLKSLTEGSQNNLVNLGVRKDEIASSPSPGERDLMGSDAN